MTVDIMIAHAAFDVRRHAPLTRLLVALGGHPLVLASQERVHANVWATALWNAVARSKADTVVCLNDDVIPHPQLRQHVTTLAELLPDQVLSLHPQFPAIRDVAKAGGRLARCYWPTGPAMAMSPDFARELLEWLKTVPEGWFGNDVNEDGALASFLWSRQQPAWCAIPALVRHDTTVPSTLPGYDQHPHRTSPVDWDDYPPHWTREHVASAPYTPVPWISDDGLRKLGDSLRGVSKMCVLCGAYPAHLFHKRGTGLCEVCVRSLIFAAKQQPRMEAP
jgi:hypothetical protein